MNQLLVLLLPLAAFSGWWLARSDKKTGDEQKANNYFKGLGYLLGDETDKAIDIFVQIAHLDASTIENQITLGNIFRYRGEIDRALHIHSTLVTKSEITPIIRQKLNLALADDYLAAGIMNHAETHYLLANEESDTEMCETARKQLIKLYAEQSLWQKAIDISHDLGTFKNDVIQHQIAHYHCEIANLALKNADEATAISQLNSALACDEKCVRATLELGRLCAIKHDYVAAINHFCHIEKQNPTYLPEIIDDLAKSYNAINQQHEWKKELQRLAKTYHNPVLTLHFNKLVAETESIESAHYSLQQHLKEKPNILMIQSFLKLIDNFDENIDRNADIHLLHESIDKVLSHTLKYRCSECGFRGNQLNWQCPGCKQWATFMPVSDVSLKENI